ncbi:MAG: hypothetical protein ACFFGZ_17865 [Candidatus Thorarchaeota archaeon]
MATELFPYDNVIIGIQVLIVGFGLHWIGQLVSVANWDFATKIGLQEETMLPEYRVYEHAIAVADVMLGWIYGIAAVGLILDESWGYKLVWIPGAIMVYHSLSYWVWHWNQTKAGHPTAPLSIRIVWVFLNLSTGILALLIAW